MHKSIIKINTNIYNSVLVTLLNMTIMRGLRCVKKSLKLYKNNHKINSEADNKLQSYIKK